MAACKFCNKECVGKGSLGNHQARCSLNPDRKVQTGRKGKTSWKKGLTKDTDVRVANSAKACSASTQGAPGRPHSIDTKEKLSKVAKERGLGGHTSKVKLHYTTVSGETVFLQSSYEVAFATLLDENGISWSRPPPLQWIDDNGVGHKYYPDFKVGDAYIDTKNDYLAIKDARKIELVKLQNNVDLRIVTKNEINKEYIALFV